MTGYIILAIALALGLWAAGTFNGLVRRRNMVAEGWSGIEAQLKRRADLIPNLVETVKGYASHERGTLDELTKLRASALDVENQWSRKFEAETAQAGVAPDRKTYSPSWYSGSSFNRLGTTSFASSLGGAVAGATAAAAAAPGRSSGSGGGGSSGGGGGGGGGGGW